MYIFVRVFFFFAFHIIATFHITIALEMGLQEDFDKAAEDVKRLKTTPADGDLLELYALYKQGTVGDVNTERPGMLDFKGKAKWDAWSHKKGTDSDKAKQDYVNKAKELVEKIGLA